MLYIEDIIALSEIVNDSEMDFSEILETFPREVLDEYAELLKIDPLTVQEQDFLEYYEDYA